MTSDLVAYELVTASYNAGSVLEDKPLSLYLQGP
jgi:hypothetical protein